MDNVHQLLVRTQPPLLAERGIQLMGGYYETPLGWRPLGLITTSVLDEGEYHLNGFLTRQRLTKRGFSCLGVSAFTRCWDARARISETHKSIVIFFDGDTVLNNEGQECALYMKCYEGEWRWGCEWLEHERHSTYRSAVLA